MTHPDEDAGSHERTGFWTTVRERISSGEDPEKVIEALLDHPEYRTTIVKLIAANARGNVLRRETRVAEREATTVMRSGAFRSAKAMLIGHTFVLPDGRVVEWVKATQQDHLMRAQWFHNRARIYDRTAQLHELAAQLIEEAGVRDLSEIESVERWPELAEYIGQSSVE